MHSDKSKDNDYEVNFCSSRGGKRAQLEYMLYEDNQTFIVREAEVTAETAVEVVKEVEWTRRMIEEEII